MSTMLEAPAVVERQREQRTVFPDDPVPHTFASILYNAYRTEWAGTRLTRWFMLTLGAGALLWAVFLTPRWLGLAFASVLVVSLVTAITWQRRRDFVHFEAEEMPDITPERLPANDKIALHATGYFSVEGDYQHFTSLPGFARTFATGEHAILCLVRERTFAGIGRWPVLEAGMWYVFFKPEDIQRIQYGTLKFAGQPRPSVAIDYSLSIPATDARRAKTLDETVYLVCADDADTPRLLADLLFGKQ